MKKLIHSVRVKWVVYVLELLIIYVIQNTPNLVPSFLGVKPMLLLVFAVSITMFEGETRGMIIGLIAGFFGDLGSSTVFGFNMLLTTVICFVCGVFVVYLMRNNIVTSLVLGAGAVLVVGLFQWFFQFALWNEKGTWYFLYAILLPRVIYSTVIMPIAFYFNRAIATHMADDD